MSDRRREEWDDLAALDPYWAICSDRERRFGRYLRFRTGGSEDVITMMVDRPCGAEVPDPR